MLNKHGELIPQQSFIKRFESFQTRQSFKCNLEMQVAFFAVAFVLSLAMGLPQQPMSNAAPSVISGTYTSSSSINSSGTYMKSKTKSKSKVCITERVDGVYKENCKDEEKQIASHSKLCTTVNVGGIVKDKCEDTYLNTDGKPCETGFKQEKKHCVRMTVLME